jgi:hypothetical protein
MITITKTSVELSPSVSSGLTQQEYDSIRHFLELGVEIKDVAAILSISEDRINAFLLEYILSRP